MTQQADKLQLCEMTTECLDSGEDIGMNNEGAHTEFGYRRFQDIPHRVCNGTGRVYLLDSDGKFGLRITCHTQQCSEYGRAVKKNHLPTSLCNGFKPTTNLWAYVRAAWGVIDDEYRTHQLDIMQAIDDALTGGTDPGRAAFDVVAEALLKGG